MKRDALDKYLEQLLAVSAVKDYCPNGLQVQGCEDINTIVTGVSANRALIESAIAVNADAIIVHHGFFWKNENPCLLGAKRERIALLLEHNINLFAYHLPLDVHPTLGNNAQFANLLTIEQPDFLPASGVKGLLALADVPPHLFPSIDNLVSHLTKTLARTPEAVIAHDRPIRRLAWCTGAAQDFIDDAIALGADAYISGEISERTYHAALEGDIHYLACGHHATERYGVNALGEHLQETLSLKHQFIDIPNPI